jgi:flagellar hook assembly protein FlgD
VALTVYDVLGRRVRTLVKAALPAGTHRVAWSGRDEAGRPVAPGVYFLRLEALGEARTGKVVRLR